MCAWVCAWCLFSRAACRGVVSEPRGLAQQNRASFPVCWVPERVVASPIVLLPAWAQRRPQGPAVFTGGWWAVQRPVYPGQISLQISCFGHGEE